MTGWLGLAAGPAFSVMAAMSAFGSPGMTMCSAAAADGPIDDRTELLLHGGQANFTPP